MWLKSGIYWVSIGIQLIVWQLLAMNFLNIENFRHIFVCFLSLTKITTNCEKISICGQNRYKALDQEFSPMRLRQGFSSRSSKLCHSLHIEQNET